MEDLSDEEIVAKVQHGDTEAYREILVRYEKPLLRYANRLLQEDTLAEDAVQESFIKAYEKLNSFDVNRKFSSWLYRIVHNQAVNQIRMRKFSLSIDVNEWLHELLPDKNTTAFLSDRESAQEMVRRCLDEVDVKYRAPLILYYLEDKSYREISTILHLPLGTVGTRIQRGLKLMKGLCEKEGGDIYVK